VYLGGISRGGAYKTFKTPVCGPVRQFKKQRQAGHQLPVLAQMRNESSVQFVAAKSSLRVPPSHSTNSSCALGAKRNCNGSSASNSTSLLNTIAACCWEASSGRRSTYSQPGSVSGQNQQLKPLNESVVARTILERFRQIRTEAARLDAAQHGHAAGFHMNGAAADPVNCVAGVAVPCLPDRRRAHPPGPRGPADSTSP